MTKTVLPRLAITCSLIAGCSLRVANAEPTANEIMKKSREAYASLKSYVGATTVRNKVDTGSFKFDQTATARISFVRPDMIHIKGKTTPIQHSSQGPPYVIVSNKKNAWLSWALQNNGAFVKQRDVSMAIAAMTGVGGQAPTVIPGALMRLGWGDPFIRAGAYARLTGHEKVDGFDCYRIVADTDMAKITYWIDSRSRLLRRMKEERNEKQLTSTSKLARDAMKRGSKSIPIPEMTLKSMISTHSFNIEQINKPVDEASFADPTKKKSDRK